jgi:radical SAM protein with 4Fe4S-binding SPASM domain
MKKLEEDQNWGGAILKNLQQIVEQKHKLNTPWPYLNFVTTLMKTNLNELPKIVQLAADTGLDEVKAVFLTVFDQSMVNESLYDHMDEVKNVFNETAQLADNLHIKLKLPHLKGEDPAGDNYHKTCFTTWRDLFLGSDGFVRPCMSTPLKFFHINDFKTFDDLWNAKEFVDFRENVNDPNKMNDSCKNCYQSSFANWNNKNSFFQIDKKFSPDWTEEK